MASEEKRCISLAAGAAAVADCPRFEDPLPGVLLPIAFASNHGLCWILRVLRIGLGQLAKEKTRSPPCDHRSHALAGFAQRRGSAASVPKVVLLLGQRKRLLLLASPKESQQRSPS